MFFGKTGLYKTGLPTYRKLRFDPYAFLTLLVGVLALLGVFVHHIPERFEALFYLFPEGTARRMLFVVGLLLIYLSEQIARRKRNAWYVTTGLLVVLIIFSLAHRFEPIQVLSYVAVLILFVSERHKFVVRSDADSFKRGFKIALVQLLIAVLVVGTIFVVLDQREFGRRVSTAQTFQLTTDALFGKPLPGYVGPTRYDRALIDMLRLTGIISAMLLLFSLFRPLRLRAKPSSLLIGRAESILREYGRDPEDFFKLYPADKHYFFYGDSFVAYAVHSGVAVVLDGAAGRETDIAHVRPAFAEYCRRNGWYVALVHSDEAEAAAWRPYGLESLPIGSEAVIDSQTFVDDTKRNKHFRYVMNRARKDELSVGWWEPPLSDLQIETLRNISHAWIENGRQEYTFIMGAFEPAYLQRCQVAVLRSGEQTVAYVNVIPSYGENRIASIDHMRSQPQTSSVAMHFLLAECIEKTHAQGFTHFNLGFVPLAKLTTESSKLTHRLLAVLRRLGSRLYSSEGLEQFKGKFEPDWSPRYLAYQGRIRQLPLAVNSLRQAVTYASPSRRRHFPVWPIILIVIAGLCYASFPIAFFLNRPFAFQGLTSALGGDGQPYAWFFNASDVISSILTIAVLSWLRRYKAPHNRLLKLTLDIALASAVCTALAALIPMPHQYEHLDGQLKLSLFKNPIVVLHGLTSFFNSIAFVAAAVLWAIHWRRTDGHLWRQLFVALTILLSTVGFIVGQMIPGLAGAIQRSFITLYATWFILFTIDILTAHRNQL